MKLIPALGAPKEIIMFGSILSSVVKVATLPIDAVDVGMDVLTGGDGSRRSRQDSPLSILTDTRDAICDVIEDID